MGIVLLLLSGCGPAESEPEDEQRGADAAPTATDASGPNPAGPKATPSGPSGGASRPAPMGTPTPPVPDLGPLTCTRDFDFPSELPIHEASGAIDVTFGGQPHLLVAADSRNDGEAILIPLPAGAPVISLVLPLDPNVSDDIEGLATAGGAVYALTSAGAVTRFLPAAGGAVGFTRDGAAYRIGAPPLSCSSLTSTNCGKNWEGLCLRPTAPAAGGCAGYAASKEEGALYCVRITGTTLAIDVATKPIVLALPEHALSDCSFGANALVVTTNGADDSKSYIVDETTGELEPLPVTGFGSNEAIHLGADGALYQLEDSTFSFLPFFGATSASSRYTCKGRGL